MIWLLASLLTFCAGAFLCLAAAGRPSFSRVVGPSVAVAGAVFGLFAAAYVLTDSCPVEISLPWSMPYGAFRIRMDSISSVFAAPLLLIPALAAVYGVEYLKPSERSKDPAFSWFFFNMLTGTMLLVVVARNAMLFLIAWELMSLSSFFLVMHDSEKEEVRKAGWTYLVAAHIGTVFLFALFILLGRRCGTLDFDGFILSGAPSGFTAAVFLLALAGFGVKAGFVPLHVWLPEAHPAAPSHVSAVMSGVMIKTGIYGIVRTLTFCGAPPPWWGWLIVAVGASSGILGVLFALAQHDIKRLLAYHSVENIGIIALGLGVGMLGTSFGNPAMAFLGYSGALLHVINHAVFKSLLFLGAGSVVHATGTRDIEHLGGLMKRMPATGIYFIVGSVAICGLPPLNGFVSEFLIYLASLQIFSGSCRPHGGLAAAGIVAICSLALIGGLAAACFAKAVGVIFLGEPRSPHAEHAHEAGAGMRRPMAILATLCFVIGLGGPLIIVFISPAARQMMDFSQAGLAAVAAGKTAWITGVLWCVAGSSTAVILLGGLLFAFRAWLLSGRSVRTAVTWDCGYAAPTPRMQYSASSFADPLLRLFRLLLRTRRRFTPPSGLFPSSSSFSTDTPDVYSEGLYRPFFMMIDDFMSRFRWLQHGRLNLYILCIILALLALLAWKLR